MDQFDSQIQIYADKLSLPTSQTTFLLLLTICFPLCMLFRFVPRQFTKIISLIIGLSFQYVLYRQSMFYHFILTFINYLILKICKKQGKKIVVIFTFILLFYFHIYRQYTCYGCYTMELSGFLMISVIKFQQISYCIDDGTKPIESLSEYQKKNRIVIFPSLLEFYSYIYFFPQSLVGPACEFSDFLLFMNRDGRYRDIPLGLTQALKTFLIGLVIIFFNKSCAIVYLFVFPKYDIQQLLDQNDWNIFYIILYFNISSTLMRSKYYFVWNFQQCQQILIGFSHSDDKNWNTGPTAFIHGELLIHPREKMELWNCQVQNWLKNYIYFRIYSEQELRTNRNKQEFANNLTFMFSALWHGFYPGYFIAFFNWSLVSILAKYCFKTSLNYPNFNYDNIIYKIARNCVSLSLMNYYGCIFYLLDFKQTWLYFSKTYFIMNIILYLGLAFFLFTGFDKPKKKKQ